MEEYTMHVRLRSTAQLRLLGSRDMRRHRRYLAMPGGASFVCALLALSSMAPKCVTHDPYYATAQGAAGAQSSAPSGSESDDSTTAESGSGGPSSASSGPASNGPSASTVAGSDTASGGGGGTTNGGSGDNTHGGGGDNTHGGGGGTTNGGECDLTPRIVTPKVACPKANTAEVNLDGDSYQVGCGCAEGPGNRCTVNVGFTVTIGSTDEHPLTDNVRTYTVPKQDSFKCDAHSGMTGEVCAVPKP